MRKLIYAINVTLDGCCDHTKVAPDEEVLKSYTRLLQDVDLMVYGRKTYELMIPYWPDIAKNHSETKEENDYADVFDPINKLVFSRSLENSEDAHTKITHADLREEILKLKQESGKSILTGGVSIPSQLIQLGLVDEFRFVITPSIVGEGRRLLDNVHLENKPALKLIESKVFDSGFVLLRYSKQ